MTDTATSRPIAAYISTTAIRHNYDVAKRLAKPARCWAVVKADAYGHGLLPVAKALESTADGFALIEIEAALALRQAGIKAPILLLQGAFSLSDMQLVVAHQLTPVVFCREQLDMVALVRDEMLPLYIKLNTGMNRLGFAAADMAWLWQRLGELSVGDMTLMTHLADADDSNGPGAQLDRFRAMTGGWVGDKSIGNSAAILRHPSARGDWVRPGIMLYGASPFARESGDSHGLLPAMSLTSRIIATANLQRGDRVGYGGLFVAETAMRIGVVACGYADGYPRAALTGTPVTVGGQLTRTLGRVSMDSIVVDLTHLPDQSLGAHVTLWGIGRGGRLPIEQVAASAGTISYELMCHLGKRVPRFVDHPEHQAMLNRHYPQQASG